MTSFEEHYITSLLVSYLGCEDGESVL